MQATGTHFEDRSTRIVEWMLMLQGELGDRPAEERRARLADALRSSLSSAPSSDRLRVLREVAERVAPREDDPAEAPSAPGARGRAAAPDDPLRVEAVVSGRVEPLARRAAQIVLERFGELPPDVVGELRARLGPPPATSAGERSDASGSARSMDLLRRVLRLPQGASIEPGRADLLLASLCSEVRDLAAALNKSFGAEWTETANAMEWPRLPRVDETVTELVEYLAGRGTDDALRLSAVRTLLAANCIVGTIEAALNTLPEELQRLRPEAIKKSVKDGKARNNSLASLVGMTASSDEQCWKQFEELVKHNLQYDALRTAYIAQIVEGAAQSFKNAVRQ